MILTKEFEMKLDALRTKVFPAGVDIELSDDELKAAKAAGALGGDDDTASKTRSTLKVKI